MEHVLQLIQQQLEQLYPELKIEFVEFQTKTRAELTTSLNGQLIILDWQEGGVFGVSVINAENEWDRMFTNYADHEFETRDEALNHVIGLIKTFRGS